MSGMRDKALQYLARGWHPVAVAWMQGELCSCGDSKCPSPGKHTIVKWAKEARPTPRQVEGWFRRWPKANLGILTGRRSGLVLVDIDGTKGLDTLRQLVADIGPLPATLRARSGRTGGGWHAYYTVRDEETSNATVKGLDFRGDGGFAIVPPSIHPSGATYAWEDESMVPAPLPAEVYAWIDAHRGKTGGRRRKKQSTVLQMPEHLRGRPTRDLVKHAGVDPPASHEDIAAALELIPNPDLGWEDWNAIGMMTFASCAGAPWGAELYDRWSRKSKKRVEGAAAAAWKRYTSSPPTQYTFGSLHHHASNAVPGWQPPSRQVRLVDPFESTHEDAPAPEQPAPQSDATHETETNGHAFPFGEDLRKKQEEKSLNPLIELNNRYAVIGDIGGKCLVLSWVPSKVDEQVKVPSFQSFKSFSERYANKYVLIKSTNSKGEDTEKFEQLGSHWLKWPSRKSYEGIDLDPSGDSILPNGHLNLWAGFAVEPRAGDWSLMKRHIADVLAAGDAEAALYITRFAAWAIQHPGERAEVALVFRGGKGSGKGTFANALKRLFGAHGLQIYSSKHLVGAFNGHLRSCLLLFADEAFWAGDKQGESVLKGMLTEATLMVEQKGIDATPWRNRLHVIMAANADWVVPASHDERRYAMFSVNENRIGDRAYFEALHYEVNHGGLGAMLHDLARVELGKWHPRQVIMTEALREQKERSLDPRHEWWESVLQSGQLPGTPNSDGHIPASVIYERARMTTPRLREVSETALGRFLRSVGGEGLHKNLGNFWHFKPLSESRKLWESKFYSWPWRNTLQEWLK